MKTTTIFKVAVAILGMGVTLAQAQQPEVPAYFKEVSTITGKQGAFNPDGSYRINVARTDVKFTNSSGMAIPADMGLSTYIALYGNADMSLGVGDVAMLQGEIDGVIDALRAGGFEVVALHNHMSAEDPRLFYLHFQTMGKTADLGKTFKNVLDVLGHGTAVTPATNVGKPKLDADALAAVFGGKPQVFPSGVLKFSSPRKDLNVTVDGMKFTPAMGLGSWAAFNACECGQTMVMGDTCCTRTDLQGAIDAYRKAGIHITSIHNHVLGASQEVMFMHYEGESDSLVLAKGIKACWDGLAK